MSQSNKKERKVSPIKRAVAGLMGVTLLAFAGLMIFNSAKQLIATMQLKQELSSVQSQLETLQTQQASLETEKAKLSDPAYVQNYARGTQLLSKSGEQVFILPKNDE